MKLKALKIVSLLLLVCSVCFGQTSVPNTDTFSLQDVYNAVHAHASGTQTNLQSCFDNSIDSYFDATYKGSKNSLYNFRNYHPSTCSTPTVTTASITNILGTTATGGGNVTADGGCTVTARGVCWGTSSNPTISNSHTTDVSGTGSFTSSLTGLSCATVYYVRAYATNSQGTAYGDNISFTAYYTTATTDMWFLASVTASGGSVYSGTTLTDAQNMCTTVSGSFQTSSSSRFFTTGTPAVGKSVFAVSAQCPYIVTGYFVYEPNYPTKTNLSIVYILNGAIQSITSCP